MVTFHYNRHEDEQYIEETIPAMEFIQRLIRHIPEKHFKMIRYGGIYARHREIDSNSGADRIIHVLFSTHLCCFLFIFSEFLFGIFLAPNY